MENSTLHKPVMVDEAIRFLRLENGHKVLDATVGCAGHSSLILKKIQPNGLLIGIDRDERTLEIAKNRLKDYKDNYRFVHANFKDLDAVLLKLNIKKIDAALFDLGLSSYQLDDAGRGFSFSRDGFLDMRMDLSSGLRAYDIVNRASREDLERIMRDFGEEKFFRRITGFVIDRRKESPIETTRELADTIQNAVGKFYRSQKINPATRTFQGIRIAVNEELKSIDEALGKIVNFLKPNARLCVISFHSLEDRIVKHRFREFKREYRGKIITKKPLEPTLSEKKDNPRARSAKLRVYEHSGEENYET